MRPQHLKSDHGFWIRFKLAVKTTGEISVLWKCSGRREKPDVIVFPDISLQPQNAEVSILTKKFLDTTPPRRITGIDVRLAKCLTCIQLAPLVLRIISGCVVRREQEAK